jgi:hypothetical protein
MKERHTLERSQRLLSRHAFELFTEQRTVAEASVAISSVTNTAVGNSRRSLDHCHGLDDSRAGCRCSNRGRGTCWGRSSGSAEPNMCEGREGPKIQSGGLQHARWMEFETFCIYFSYTHTQSSALNRVFQAQE